MCNFLNGSVFFLFGYGNHSYTDNHICSNNSINLKVLASLHIPSIISLSGYTIWVFGNSNTDQSQLAVRHGNRQEIEHVWLPLTEVQEGFQLTETHVTRDGFSYRFPVNGFS